ncbi:MAG TPA: hypothetical protein VGN17_06495 [Bryobacteraceae bacterium]|jgi:hypothetical protein
MKAFVRVFLTMVAALATYLVLLLMVLPMLLRGASFYAAGEWAALACAVLVAAYLWPLTDSMPTGLAACVGFGAAITGGIGFLGGFLGPMIFDPGANQGPMLGIFITGPLGFLLGALGGAIYWMVRRPRAAAD